MPDLLPEQAQEILLSCCKALDGTEVLPLQRCLGRVLAEDLVARVSHPPRRVSAMDGYAVRASEACRDAVLRLVGSSAAGSAYVPALSTNAAVQVFTGASLPDEADAVLIDEHSVLENSAEGSSVRVQEQPTLGRYIRTAGSDFAQGSVCLQQNHLLSLRDIALAATMNYAWLSVRSKPRISIVASGDELAQPGEVHDSHHLSAANSLMLAMLAESFGAEARVVPFAHDSLASLTAAFKNALAGADLVVASGGASHSAADWTGAALSELGIEERFSRLAMRPGKPTRFGIMGGEMTKGEEVPVLVLPGNPASVYVGALVFLRPMVEKMLALQPTLALQGAVLASNIEAGGARCHYMRARLEGGILEGRLLEGGVVRVFSDQESSHTSVLARANCLAVQPARAAAKKKGERIEILPML